jgi:hypothetical protein
LETTLRSVSVSVSVDASAVYRTSSVDFSDTRTSEKVTQFLKAYQDRRSSTQYLSLTEGEAVGMAAFHSSIIKPLARHYISWALANLANETKNSQSHKPLSRTEETRLLRALYRFELCCNLFGLGRHGTIGQKSDFKSKDILKMFICIFEPWEVEEIACMYTFSEEKYIQIFDDIRSDVHEENPKFADQRPEGAFDFDTFG